MSWDFIGVVYVAVSLLLWLPSARYLIRLMTSVVGDGVERFDIFMGSWLGLLCAFIWPVVLPALYVASRLAAEHDVVIDPNSE